MKGYWLIHGGALVDAAAHADYVALWGPIAAKYGARNVTGEKALSLIESRATERLLLIEFPDLATAKACYEDPAYQAAMVKAKQGSSRDLVMFAAEIA